MLKKIVPVQIKEFLLKRKAVFGKAVQLGKGVTINKNSFFEGHNSISNNTEFSNSYLGLGSYIAVNSVIRYAKIGRFCAVGDNVRTGLGLHPTTDFVSIHPAFFSLMKPAGFTFSKTQLFEEHKFSRVGLNKYTCIIGNDVWIGNNALIMDGIEIGDGAIIAAGAVVTKNVTPYSIVGGVPAKLIKYRFSEIQIQKLLDIKWWNWNFNEIMTLADKFKHIDEFILECEKVKQIEKSDKDD